MILVAGLSGVSLFWPVSAPAASRAPSYVGLWHPAGLSCGSPAEILTSYTRYSMRSDARSCRIVRVDTRRPNWTLTLDCKGGDDGQIFSIVEEIAMSEDTLVLKVAWHSPDLASRGEHELHRCP
jgi:hypothetical protein